jgi:transposase-like protein
METELVTKAEIARRLGVDPSAVSQWIKRRQFIKRALPKKHNRYDWAEVVVWAREWKSSHPHSLPGVELGPDKALEQTLLEAEVALGEREKGCICPAGIISLTCPIHAGASL